MTNSNNNAAKTSTAKTSTAKNSNVTSHIREDENMIITPDAITVESILTSVKVAEALDSEKRAVTALTKEVTARINKDSEKNRKVLSDIFRTKLNVPTAESIINELLSPLNGGNDTERKRAQRRRDFLRKCAKEAFPIYDTEVSKGKKGGVVSFKFVGDEHTRKALAAMEIYNDLRKYVTDLPDLNTTSVAALFRAGEPESKGVLGKVPARLITGEANKGATVETLGEIAARIINMKEIKEQANS